MIERDFNDAVDRLVAKQPTNAKLKRQASRSLLKVNIANVALEAKRARSGISHEKCLYPAVRARVLALMNSDEMVVPRSSADVIIKLRQTIRELTVERNAALAGQTEHLLARLHAEREATKWREALKRLDADRKRRANVIPLRGEERS